MFCEKKDREKMRLASHTLEDPAGGVVRGLIDDLDELESSLSAARAEVERLRADLEVAESRKSDVIQRLSRVEAAAKAWEHEYHDRRTVSCVQEARAILKGIGPDGRKVEVG